jgi:hypothetical protein
MATLLELKQKLAEEEKALKEKYAEKLAAAKKREQRAETLEAKKRRKLEDHGKYMLAGIVLADMKHKKDASLLTGFLKTLTRKNDIDAIQSLIDLVLKPEAAVQSSKVSPSSKPLPKTEAPQKS